MPSIKCFCQSFAILAVIAGILHVLWNVFVEVIDCRIKKYTEDLVSGFSFRRTMDDIYKRLDERKK